MDLNTHYIIRSDDRTFYCLSSYAINPNDVNKIITKTTFDRGLQVAYFLNILHGNEPTSAQITRMRVVRKALNLSKKTHP